MFNWNWIWTAHIAFWLDTKSSRCWICASPIVHGLHALVSNVGRGLPLSSIACTHRPVDVEYSLPTSYLSGTHQFTKVKCGLAASLLACTYQSGDIARCLPPSSLSCTMVLQYLEWTYWIYLGIHIMVTQRWALPACITFGLHTIIIRRRMWPTRFTIGLHILVSWRHTWSSCLVFIMYTTVADVRCGLPALSTLSTACTHWSFTVKLVLIASSVAYTHWSVDSNVVCQDRL